MEVPEAIRRAMLAAGVDPDEIGRQADAYTDEVPDEPIEGQTSLLGVMFPPTDNPSGDDLKAQGMAEAEAHADPSWRIQAWNAILVIVGRGEPFTTDDVWEMLDTSTHEPRALGSLLVRARSQGLIRGTGEWRNSRRPEAHSRPCAVWEPVA